MAGGLWQKLLCFREKTRNKKKMREVRDKRADATNNSHDLRTNISR